MDTAHCCRHMKQNEDVGVGKTDTLKRINTLQLTSVDQRTKIPVM